jgi:hypothetical protein
MVVNGAARECGRTFREWIVSPTVNGEPKVPEPANLRPNGAENTPINPLLTIHPARIAG